MGAPAAPPLPLVPSFVVALLLVISSNTLRASGAADDSAGLLQFKSGLINTDALRSWNASTPPCDGDGDGSGTGDADRDGDGDGDGDGGEKANWAGVVCWYGHVWGLRLENMGLAGRIDAGSLATLPYLRTLSLMNNNFTGAVPAIQRLRSLKSLYLSNNAFSGPIPSDEFAAMNYLKRLYLDNNQFSGPIPASLASLPRLVEVKLDHNLFQGPIPLFHPQTPLKLLNLSYNRLQGPIPPTLTTLPISSFLANGGLCGKPLNPCSPLNSSSPTTTSGIDGVCGEPGEPCPAPPQTPKKTSGTKITIIILSTALALIIFALIFILCYCKKAQRDAKLGRVQSFDSQLSEVGSVTPSPGKPQVHHVEHHPNTSKKAEHWKLTFVREDREKFALHDLLRASAEVLGSGNFGASYKASVVGGRDIVVKRFKLMNNVGKEDFQEHMRRLGRLRHENLLPLVAYYYRREEKLLVFDFIENGSLASHLHGNHSEEQPGLDWPTRLKIIKGVVKGLAYLFSELPSLMLPHGHLKSSNVLLNESYEPLLMDYALVPLINPEGAQQLMVAYKSPEYTQLGRTLKKTDVWSLGILILEVLTGKFPASYLTLSGGDTDLKNWVSLIASEESSGEVFDRDMGGTKNAEGEMHRLLRIGLACCEDEMERRWELREVVEKVEQLKERDSD